MLLGPSGRLLGPSWGALESFTGTLGAILEDIDQKRGELFLALPLGSPNDRLFGRSWGALGALLGPLGAVLELSWAPLEALLGHLEASEGHRKRKSWKANISDFP